MSMWQSNATNVPSSSWHSGLTSARVRPYCVKALARRDIASVSRTRSPPPMPRERINSLAWKSENGVSAEKLALTTCSGCSSATCSMSMPPMSLKIITGSLAMAS